MRWIILLTLLPLFSTAQKWVGIDNGAMPIDQKEAHWLLVSETIATDTIAVKLFLKSRIENLKHTKTNLVLENQIESPKGTHYRFSQTLNGRKVFRGSVKLNIGTNGRILSLFDHTFPVPSNLDAEFPEHTPYHQGLAVHYTAPNNGRLHRYKLREVYFFENSTLVPSIHLEVLETTDRYYELVLDKQVKVVYQNDLLSYATAPQDSTVTLWVFNPDPLTTANQNYGAPYIDSFDQDVVELNAERVAVQAPATFENDTFFLRNNFVSIEEFSLPAIEPVTSTSPLFNYTRAESGFEDVNAFYHISYFQQYIQSLGFNNIVNYAIAVDAHALNGSDNSNFNSGFSPPRLHFGEGGVDDAEDADVIIHEYGHAIMHATAPGTNNGTQRKTMDEAIGDYFASSYSRFLSPNRWEDVFTWDGYNEYWNGRSSVSSDHYPEDLDNNIYTDADIWSATLMQIWGDIGREATDAIMLQTAYSFSEGMTMTQAALLFLQADTLLFNGSNFTPIHQRMFDRGLIPWNVGIEDELSEQQQFRVVNTAEFATGTGAAQVISDETFNIRLYNGVGKLLRTQNVTSGLLRVASNDLAAGLYILEIEVDGISHAIKLIKH